jgi:Raf kinase inhibitor-like YbhB/YbcL family protein
MRISRIAAIVVAGALVLGALGLAGCNSSSKVAPSASTPNNAAPTQARQVGIVLDTPAAQRDRVTGQRDYIPDAYLMKGVPGGANVSLPYTWRGVPAGTKSLAFTIVDNSAFVHRWVHWMVVDISVNTTRLAEGASRTARMPVGARELRNTFGFIGYGGPAPGVKSGPHPYVATLYALDVRTLPLPTNATIEQFDAAIKGHLLADGSFTAMYERSE